jgi:hypothetical protein
MTEFEQFVLQELSEIKTTAVSTNATVVALDKRLFNGSGVIPTMQAAIDELKEENRDDSRWDKAKDLLQLTLAPVLVGLHILAHKLGFKV